MDCSTDGGGGRVGAETVWPLAVFSEFSRSGQDSAKGPGCLPLGDASANSGDLASDQVQPAKKSSLWVSPPIAWRARRRVRSLKPRSFPSWITHQESLGPSARALFSHWPARRRSSA